MRRGHWYGILGPPAPTSPLPPESTPELLEKFKPVTQLLKPVWLLHEE